MGIFLFLVIRLLIVGYINELNCLHQEGYFPVESGGGGLGGDPFPFPVPGGGLFTVLNVFFCVKDTTLLPDLN